MGKVGSTSVKISLEDLNLSTPVYHVHFLSWEMIKEVEKFYLSKPHVKLPKHLIQSKFLRNLIDQNDHNLRWKIITLVRDPVAREISDMFQNIERDLPGLNGKDDDAAAILEEHIKLHFEKFDESIDYANCWFDRELKNVFNFDIYSIPFNKKGGYQIYQASSADVLLIRLENLSKVFGTALSKFMNIDNAPLIKGNVAENKSYRSIYERILNNISIPTGILDKVYASNYAMHFYTKNEINDFKIKWSKEDHTSLYHGYDKDKSKHRINGKILIIHPEGNINNNPNLTGIVKILAEHNYWIDIISPKRPEIYQHFQSQNAQLQLIDAGNISSTDGFVFLANKRFDSSNELKNYIRDDIDHYDLIIGIDRGIIEASLIAKVKKVPYGLISYEIFFAEEAGKKFKAKEIEACKDLAFAVCQGYPRSENLAIENEISHEKIIDIPVCGLKTNQYKKDDYLYNHLQIDRGKKIVLYIGSIDKWTMADFIIDNFKAWPEEWVLVIHNRYGLDPKTLQYYERYKNLKNICFSNEPVTNPDELHRFIRSADLGVALYQPQYGNIWTGKNIQLIGMSSGKIASFIQHGVPVIVNEIGVMADYVRKYKLGLVINNSLRPNFNDQDLLLWQNNCFEFSKQKLDLTLHMKVLLKYISKATKSSSVETNEKITIQDHHLKNNRKNLPLAITCSNEKRINSLYTFQIGINQKFPQITIVTPNLNQGRFLDNCIRSVVNQNYPNLEYLVIDGGSKDNSVEIIKKYENKLTHWLSEEDRGQSDAINKGLAMSSGRIFSWLNADDFLEPGALFKVADAYRSNKDAAAWVGACRRIDEKGNVLNVIFPNGLELVNIGQNYNGRQLYQPACFFSAQRVKRVGGLDPSLHFAMDFDLYLRLLKNGLFIIGGGIWANALIHSAAKTQASRSKMFEEIIYIQKKCGFTDGAKNRHQRYFGSSKLEFIAPRKLQYHLVESQKPFFVPDTLPANKKPIVFISNYLPRFDRASAHNRIHHILNILKKYKRKIIYLYSAKTRQDQFYKDHFKDHIDFVYVPLELDKYYEIISKSDTDCLWVTNLWSLNYFSFIVQLTEKFGAKRSFKLIADTMDFHFKKYKRKYDNENDIGDLSVANKFKQLETQLYRHADCVVAVSRKEKKDIQAHIGGVKLIEVIPNIHPISDDVVRYDRRNHICFAGNFEVNHNIEAARYFIKDIFPFIIKRHPQIEFHIIGHKSRQYAEEFESPNIKVIGHVDNLEKSFDYYKLFVCPMRYGAGMKGKIGSAASAGLPIVSTSIGTEGFPVSDGIECFIADDSAEFSEKCNHLLNDPIGWHHFSLKARLMMADNFSPDKVAVSLDKIISTYGSGAKQSEGRSLKRITDNASILKSRLDKIGWLSKTELYERCFEYLEKNEPTSAPDISIIVISWRLHPDTIRNLKSLSKQRNHNFELIFVDNGGKSGEFDDLKIFVDTYIKLNQNTGAYLARNLGACFAGAPILLFLEDDGIPARDCVESHLRAFDRYDVIAVRGIYAPMTKENPANRFAGHYYLGNKPFPIYADVEGNTSYRADIFYEVGGWDDEIVFGGGGVDLSRRLLEIEPDHRKQIYSPEPVIFHDYAKSKNHLKTKQKKQEQSRRRLRRKHPDYKNFFESWKKFNQRSDALIRKNGCNFEIQNKHKTLENKNDQKVSADKPRFSICIPTFNRATFLKETIQSAQNQKYDDFEIVVVDDGSTDDTEKIVKRFSSDKIRYIKKEHEGAPHTRNRCVQEASGDFVLWLDSDDLLNSNILKIYKNVLCEYPDADIVYCNLKSLDENGKLKRVYEYTDWYENSTGILAALYSGSPIPNGGTLIRKSVFDEIGLYNEEFSRAHDFEFWTRVILAKKYKAKHVNQILYTFIIHDKNLTGEVDKNTDFSFERDIYDTLFRDEHLIDLFPNHSWSKNPEEARYQAYYKIANRYAQIQGYSEAIRFLKKYRTYNNSSDIQKFLGTLHYQAGHYDKALRIFSRLHQRLPNDAGIVKMFKHLKHKNDKGYYQPGTSQNRILIACDYFWPSIGGVELYVEDLALRLKQRGYQVDVSVRWLPDRNSRLYKEIRIHEFKCNGSLSNPATSTEIKKLRSLILSGCYDTVIALTQPDNWVGMALTDLPQHHPRIILLPSINATNLSEWKITRQLPIVEKVLRAADRLVAVTESGCDAQFFKAMGFDYHFIPHAVEQNAVSEDFRLTFNLSKDFPLLVMVANFWPVKNHLGLLRAMAGMSGDWQLVLIGHQIAEFKDCYKRVTIAASKDPRVRIIDGLQREQAAAAIRDADLLLVPSKGESAGPLVVLQAMSYGTPWIATPECNAVRDEAGGIITVLSGFPKIINYLIAQPSERKALGHLGQAHWQACFTWNRTFPLFISLIEGQTVTTNLAEAEKIKSENQCIQNRITREAGSTVSNARDVSVIISTFNRSATLRKCLDALAKQTLEMNKFEVIVCDDGSTDNTEKEVKNYPAPYKLIYRKHTNKGPAAARNIGIRSATGNYLLFINDDSIAEPDLLEQHLHRLIQKQDQKVAVLGRFSLLPDYTRSLFGYTIENSDLLFEYNKMQPEQLHDYRFFYTGNISIARAAVLDVGMFDENFCGPAAEDIELGYRLQKKGYKVFYEPKCIAWHNHELSIENFCKTNLTRGYGAITLYAKHPELCWFKNSGGQIIDRWKQEVDNFSSKINDVIQIVRTLNDVKSGNGDSSFTSADVNKIYPSLKFLFQYHMQKGYLSNPELSILMSKQTGFPNKHNNVSGIEATYP
jgi:glycosyltransferase involved in cell wall biosynthesis